MNPSIVDIWQNVGTRIGFYTKETVHKIPEAPGCYAWFIPLWMYSEDIDELLNAMNWLLVYDSKSDGWPHREALASFNWEELNIRLQRNAKQESDTQLKTKWDMVMGNEIQKAALSRALMEATIYTPPIYIGHTKNLKLRYEQHTSKRSAFRQRFDERIEEGKENNINLSLTVKDLLFACIQTSQEANENFNDKDLRLVVEQVLMRVCKPTFSLQ